MNNETVVTKRIELDYGHTLPDHYSFCNQIHGHRGKVEVTIKGIIRPAEDKSSHGMILDFSILKEIMMERIHKVLDHGFAVWKDDEEDLNFIIKRNKKYLITDIPPTAEYLAQWAYDQVHDELTLNRGTIDRMLSILLVRWYETPNSWADYIPK